MSVINSIRKQIPPIHPEGYVFIAIFAVVTLVLGWIYDPLFWVGLVLTIWCAYFFRDPQRVTPLEEGLVISPADGMVSAVGPAAPPPELGLGAEPLLRISIFMSVFDCSCEPRAYGRAGRQDRLSSPVFSSMPISTRRARTMSATAS